MRDFSINMIYLHISKKQAKSLLLLFSLVRSLNGINADLLLILALVLKAHDAVYLCKQGIIAADANVNTGMNLGASLANQDVAGEYELTVSTLRAKTLGFAIATVTRRTKALLMSEKLKIKNHLLHLRHMR